MQVLFPCLTCGAMLGVDTDSASPSVNCPACKSILEVPAPDTVEMFRCVNCNVEMGIVGRANGTSIECPVCHKGIVVSERLRRPKG
jgi:DNA-directed RNA polymerase subunit RPC12/RpoP